jgi:Tfp pilus assembly protein PilX
VKTTLRPFLVICLVFASTVAGAAERAATVKKGTVTVVAADQTLANAEWPAISANQQRKVTANTCTGTVCTQYETCTLTTPKECKSTASNLWCRYSNPIKGACLCSSC